MKLFKMLLVIITLALSSQATDFGIKGMFVNNDVGPGLGGGLLLKIDLADIFFLYPNVDVWYSGDGNSGRYWDYDHWVYYDSWGYSVFETAFNMDAAFQIPVSPVQPYMGLGLAPTLTSESWADYSEYDHTYVNLGFNVFGGIFFPLGSYTGMFELRGKFGNPYNVLKISFGIMFEPRIYYYRTTRRHHRDRD
jgi:hypothetical protein